MRAAAKTAHDQDINYRKISRDQPIRYIETCIKEDCPAGYNALACKRRPISGCRLSTW